MRAHSFNKWNIKNMLENFNYEPVEASNIKLRTLEHFPVVSWNSDILIKKTWIRTSTDVCGGITNQ